MTDRSAKKVVRLSSHDLTAGALTQLLQSEFRRHGRIGTARWIALRATEVADWRALAKHRFHPVRTDRMGSNKKASPLLMAITESIPSSFGETMRQARLGGDAVAWLYPGEESIYAEIELDECISSWAEALCRHAGICLLPGLPSHIEDAEKARITPVKIILCEIPSPLTDTFSANDLIFSLLPGKEARVEALVSWIAGQEGMADISRLRERVASLIPDRIEDQIEVFPSSEGGT